MGEPIPLVKGACPCGWKAPRRLSVDVMAAPAAFVSAVVAFDCPECGRRLEMRREKARELGAEERSPG